MITLTKAAYYAPLRYAEYSGLSTDDKAAIDAHNADQFYEIDTGKYYRYNEVVAEWIEQPADTPAIDTGLPPITSETSGYFLTNDGSVTHWREIASADFIINLTDNHDGTYTADKTYVEIKSAYDAHENIAVAFDSSRLPLMNAQFQGDNAGFTFGYTQVTTDGQLVSTRAIHYLHTVGEEDEWTDSDEVGQYLQTEVGGTINGNISMANNAITDVQELQVSGQHPLFLGNVIHAAGQAGVRIAATTNGEAAVVAPDSQSTYRPINVGNPTADDHAVTLGYLTEGLKDDAATKNHVNLVRNSGSTYAFRNGVYLLSACDSIHRGLTCVYVCGETTTVFDLSGMAGWKVSKGAVANSIYIDNTSDVQDLDVYIVAIGESAAI